MRCLALLVCLAGATSFAHADASPSSRNGAAPVPFDDFHMHVSMLMNRCSIGGPYERGVARAWFLDHPGTYPRLLSLLDPSSPEYTTVVMEVLPLFGRADSVPPMERLLAEGSELTSWRAGELLGTNPHPAALAALLRQVRSTNKETLYGATLGLMNRRDASACPTLLAQTAKSAGSERHYYLFQAAGRLGCIARSRLEAVARDDANADLRQLAGRILRNEP
jgi:hypothetical protein